MIHIGFTGSRYGMSDSTKVTLLRVAYDLLKGTNFPSSPTCFHHGDCIGSDKTASEVCKSLGYLVHAHPPFDDSKRAFSEANDVIHAPKDYIERNHDIVDISNLMLATPHTMSEVLRSGTWATIRYARKLKRELCIILPDGSENWENSDRPDRRPVT